MKLLHTKLAFALTLAVGTATWASASLADDTPNAPAPSIPAAAVPPVTSPGRDQLPIATSNAIPSEVMSQCGRRWIEEVYPSRSRSVVRVETVAGLGSGFVFGDTRHVATAFHVVALGRPLRVVFSSGKETRARAVAIDPEHDLAILELDDESPAPPLVAVPTNESPEVGSEVVVIGHPLSGLRGPATYRLDGLLNWSASRGIISAKNTVLLQTDASVNPGNSGGPMLDCGGRLLGVVSWKVASSEVDNIAFAVRTTYLTNLWQAGRRGVYMGRVQGTGAFSLLGHFQPVAPYLGIGIGLGTNWFDRADFTLRGGYMWGLSPDTIEPIVIDTRRRLMVQAELRARLLLTRGGFYLAAGGGASYFHDRFAARRFELKPDPACAGASGCGAVVGATEVSSSYGYFRPLATVAAVFARNLELGYTLVPDFGAFGDSVHQVSITVVGAD